MFPDRRINTRQDEDRVVYMPQTLARYLLLLQPICDGESVQHHAELNIMRPKWM
jgi:hypothetical protein